MLAIITPGSIRNVVRGRSLAMARAAGRAFAMVVLCAGASRAVAQIAPAIDPNDPAMVEEISARVAEAFEDMPFEINPAGMTSGEGMFGAFFGPSVTKADFKKFIAILKLDKEQSEAAGMVYAQRLANYEAKGKPMQDMIMELMQKMGGAIGRGEQPKEPENIEQLSKAGEEIQKEREAMTKGVMGDLKDLVNAQQLERWPKVEMAERRNTLMRFQPLLMAPGVQVDVRVLVETTLAKKGIEQPDAAEKERIEQALAVYDTALDEQAKVAAPLDEAMRSQGIVSKPTPEQQEQMMKAMGQGGVIAERVRTANEAAVKSITSALPESTKAVLMDAYRAQAFPAIYKKMHGETVLEAAVKLADLTDEQREKLTKMKDEHWAKLKDLRPKAADQAVEANKRQTEWMAAKDEEAKQKAMEKMTQGLAMTARSDMRAADKEVVKQVRALMTDAQREKLPKRPKPNMPFEITPPAEVEKP